jgi:hypothetical protein
MPTMPRSLSDISQRLQGDPVTPEYRAKHRGRDRLAGRDRIEIKKNASSLFSVGRNIHLLLHRTTVPTWSVFLGSADRGGFFVL